MRVLAVLRNESLDEEVITVVRRLTTASDEVHVLVLQPASAVAETISRRGALVRNYPTPLATLTGMLLPADGVYPHPAESQAQAESRVSSAILCPMRTRLDRIEAHTSIEVAFTDNPADAVLDAATARRVDGIAIGGQEAPWWSRWLRPSLAETVLRRAGVPVLVVQAGVRLPRAGAALPESA